jgi:putative transposase
MKSRFKKLSHPLYECKYHIVMCPRYRHCIFRDEIAEYAKQQLYGLCRQKDVVELLDLNILADHIHLVVSIPPKYSVSAIIDYLKGKLSISLFQKY